MKTLKRVWARLLCCILTLSILGSATISAAPVHGFAVTLPASATEADWSRNGTVSVTPIPASDLVVGLKSSDTTEVTAPATVTIPAGQSSAKFPLTFVDDATLDGSQMAVITASATGYTSGTASIVVNDNETARLFVSLPAKATDEVAAVQGTVTVNSVPGANVVVTLTSSDPTTAVVPATVTIPAGQTSTPFSMTIIGDSKLFGVRNITVTAHVANWTDGSATTGVLLTQDWPTFGNGPAHTGYQPIALGTSSYEAGWTKTFPMSTRGINQVAVSNGRIFVTPYVYFDDTFLSALDASNGEEIWRHQFITAFSINPPTVDGGRVYTQRGNHSSDSQLWCLDATNGTTAWSTPFMAQWERYFAPTVFNDGAWVDGGYYGGLYGFNTSDGSQRFFNSTLAQYDQWTPSYYDGVVYTWVAGVFRAHDPMAGTILWSSTLSSTIAGVAAIDAGKAVVIGNPNLYAIDLATHATAWTVNGTFQGSPAVANGTVFVLSSGDAKAYNSQTGALVGTYSTGDASIAGQPIITDDALIVASPSKTYIFNLQTFALKQTLNNGGVASLANGVIYLAGGDGVLRTFYPGGMTTIAVGMPASASEGGPVLTGTVTLSKALPSSTEVSLTASNPARLAVPASVTIPANQTSGTFQFSVVNDLLVNGSQNVTVTAKGPTYLLRAGSTSITVNDNEPVILTLNVSSSLIEGGTTQATLAMNAVPADDIVVALASSDIGEITVPPTAVIRAGQTGTTFTVKAVDDGIVDGTRTATVTAHVANWIDGSATINVLDSGRDITPDWPTHGNGPAHTGYQPITLGTSSYEARWTKTFPTSTGGINQVAVANGTVFVTPYVYFNDTFLSALDASTGAELWRKNFASSFSINPPTVNAGRVFTQKGKSITPGNDSQLLCLDANSGSAIWTAPFGAQWERYFAPPVFNDGVWVDGGTYGGLYGFNTSNGSQRFFNSSLAQYDQWTPSYYEGVVYTWVAGVFRAHDPMTGTILWSSTLSTGTPYSVNTVPAFDLGKAFAIGSPNLYAIDLATHATAWTANGAFKGSPATANQVVYALIGSSVQAYNSQTGALVGTYSTGDASIAGQPIITDDALIVASPSKTYIFNLQTFALRQTLNTGGVASLANGVIYLAGGDGVLRTFRPSGQNTITLALSASSATEGNPALTGTVSLSRAAGTDTVISLVTGGSTRVSVPSSVTIPAGQTSRTFSLAVVDDALLNGSEIVTVVAKGPSYLFFNGSAPVTIHDNEAASISLVVPATVAEGVGSVTGTLTLSAAPAVNVNVSLASNDTTEATVPPVVMVPADQKIATFPITIVDDDEIDGTRTATVTASVAGWTSGAGTIQVTDNENRNLALSGATAVAEGGTFTGTVSITGTLPANVVVTLVSSNPAQLTVPPSVTILAGQKSATFIATAVDDTITDGTQSVVITATAATFTSATMSISVYDTDVHHFSFTSTIATPQIANKAFATTIEARDINDVRINTYNGGLNLTGSSAGGLLTVLPATITMSSGWWSGSLAVTGSARGVKIVAGAGAITGVSNSFDVGVGTLDHLAWNPIGLSQTIGTPFSAVVMAKDFYENTLPTVSGSATLSTGTPARITGTETGQYGFLFSTSTQQRDQAIYQQAEIGAAGRIANLAMQANIYTGGTLTNFTVRMKHTNLAGYAASQGWETTGWTTVYQGNLPVQGTGTVWVNVPLTASFQYDGTSNLMIDFTHNGSWSGNANAVATSKSNTRTLWCDGSGYASPLVWSGTSNPTPGTSSGLPNLRLGFDGPVPVTPAGIILANGTWSGLLTVNQAASNIVLKAKMTAGTAGESNAFNVTGAPAMQVTPTSGLSSSGTVGGPFSPVSGTYILSNTGGSHLNWMASKNAGWLSLSATAGTLQSGSSTTVITTINASDASLQSGGNYNGTITFTNTTNGAGNTTRPVSLTIQAAAAPLVAVTSPMVAMAPSATIWGTASDSTGVQSVTVNGATADTTDGFAHWSAQVSSLSVGANAITVVATDNTSDSTTLNQTLTCLGDADKDGLCDAWESAHKLDSLASAGPDGALGDLDKDGIANLLEYALNLDPQSPDSTGLPTSAVAINPADGKPYLTYSYRRRIDSGGLQYMVEVSSDLINWSSAAADLEQIGPATPNADGITETVTVRVKPSITAGSGRYARLRVSVQ